MNIKKSFLVALATVTAATSVSAFAVSAATLGASFQDVSFSATGEAQTITASFDGVEVKAELPKTGKTGNFMFHVAFVADKDVENAFDAVVSNEAVDVIELSFLGSESGTAVSDFDGAKITITAKDKEYNAVYSYADGKFTAVDASGNISFTKGAATKYVIAKVKSGTPDTKPTPDPDKGTKTGDNTAATATVFAVMGVVALGTVVAATKMKKASK